MANERPETVLAPHLHSTVDEHFPKGFETVNFLCCESSSTWSRANHEGSHESELYRSQLIVDYSLTSSVSDSCKYPRQDTKP